ncbi:ATP-binding protein [Actinocorallia populi]|uniref:ATP-binding protein n=1 Tax=Actinocorallia populi TaxID=2079200 RepID=UPI000D08BB01|nr:ATP-binding protein [Actinocorallia populi]
MRTENPPVPTADAVAAPPSAGPRDPHPSEQDFVLHLRAYENGSVVARRLTRLVLDLWDWQGDPDAPLTVMAELFANACQAAPGGPVRLGIAWTPAGVRLECHDPAPDRPPVPSLPDDLSETGRGLYLVAAFSARHGISPAPPPDPGKTLWAVIPHAIGA